MEFNYQETFELMAAYHELGKRECKIIEYLMTTDVFEGNYSDLAKQTNIKDVSNLRNCLVYLDSIGLVYIVKEKYWDDVKEYIRKDGKLARTQNSMKACYLVDGWMEILLKQHKNGLIHDNVPKKMEVVNHADNQFKFEMMDWEVAI